MDNATSRSGTSFTSPFSSPEDIQQPTLRRGGPLYSNCSLSPPSTPPQQPPDRPFSLQKRRLQLRHAGFRGPTLPSRRVTPPLAGWRAVSEGPVLEDNKENGCKINSKLGSFRTRQSSILQEISNSAQRRHCSPCRPSITAVFQDFPHDPLTAADLCSPISAKRKRRLASPSHSETLGCDNAEGGMESSTPTETPLLRRSPFSSLERKPRRRDVNSRLSNFATSRYIEHLENQLAAALNRVESMDSSALSGPASRLKAANAEQRMLQHELEEWESRFDAKLREETEAMVEKESHLRRRIRGLERDIELKDNRIRELEWEVEMDSHKLRNLDAVNTTNRSLERRVDVLTELIAQSPTRVDLMANRLVDATPAARDGARRTPRPKSMYSRIPISPVRRSHFQPLLVPKSDLSQNPPGPFHSQDDSRELLPNSRDGCNEECAEERPESELGSLDSGLGESCYLLSTRHPGSQRSSLISHSSSGSSFWGASHPISPEFAGKLPYRQRNMRCFPPGSSTLKPLILPSASGTLPFQYTTPCPIQNPDFSTAPAVSFHLSHTGGCVQSRPRHDSSQLTPEDSLNALEGKSHHYETFEQAIAGQESTVGMPDNQYEGHPLSHVLGGDIAQETFTTVFEGCNSNTVFDLPLEDMDVQAEPSKDLPPYGSSPRSSSLCPVAASKPEGVLQRKNPFGDRDVTGIPQFAPHSTSLYGCGHAPGGQDLRVGEASEHIRSIWESIPNATILARRIMANAWHTNWNRLGRLSWWVFGLFIGNHARNESPQKGCAGVFSGRRYFSDTCELKQSSPLYSLGSTMETESPGGTRLTVCSSHKSGWKKLRQRPSRENITESTLSPLSRASFSRSIHLWMKFSLALVLAIGLAIKDGPASLMAGCVEIEHCMAKSIPVCPTNDNAHATSRWEPRSASERHDRIYGDDGLNRRVSSPAAPESEYD